MTQHAIRVLPFRLFAGARPGTCGASQGESRVRPVRVPTTDSAAAFLSHRDLNQLLVRCIETPEVPFAIVQAVSNNRFKRLDITKTRELLGYDPRDDAFQLFGVGLLG